MRSRLRAIGRGVLGVMRAIGQTLVAEIGRDEIMLLLALVLVASGLWDVWRPGSLLAPGAVLLWMFLPQRVAFIHHRQADKPRRAE